MNLAFSHPLFLFGLAAGILPILIHRLIQRKAVSRDFSAVRLLLQSQKIMSRPHRLKHFLLLALRVLAVSTLALLMARPILTPRGLQAMAADGVKALILDNSLSTGYREERGERFEIAKGAARKILKSFSGRVIVIPTVSVLKAASGERENRWMNPDEARKALDTIPLSYGRGNPGSALSLAYRELRDKMGPKEVVILSDMARGDWEGFDWSKMGIVSGEVDVHFFRIGGEERDDNLAVRGVELAEGEAVVGVPSRLEVGVANFSGRDGAPLVQLYLAGVKVDQKRVEVKAGGEGRLSFELFLNRPGWVEGEIRLSGDALPSDDTFYFSLNVRERVRVLLVDGDPGRSLKSSESYYLANALNPGGYDTSPFLTRVVTEEEFPGIELQPYEAVFLLNVAKPPGSRVASFLESGKPVILFLGDQVKPGEYNRIPLFPWRLGEVKGEGRPERIVQADVKHGALRDFSGPPGESLKKASIYRYYRIEGATRNLLSLGSQDPLLVEASQGKGRLFLFASSANLHWNDLPLKAAYLPLIQGLLKDAVGLSRDNLSTTLRFGDPLEEESTQVTGPAGGPGVYSLSRGGKEIRRAVNPPLEESDLSKLSGGEIQKRFGTLRVKIWEYREEDWNKGLTGKRELWPFLLGFLLVVLMAEMGVASRT